MKSEKNTYAPDDQPTAERYVSGDLPPQELPPGVLRDNRPRKDGPGGESKNSETNTLK